jgi:ABC-type glycerol-3-phosphate transport system substrate-binding protein
VSLAAQLSAGSTPAQAEDITLQFTVWNYSLDTIQDNGRKFEAQNPGIKVKVTDTGPTTMAAVNLMCCPSR